MKSIIAAVAALAASVVSAQSITSSQPTLNQVIVAGSTTQIVWSPVSGTISSIDLRKGDASALTTVAQIASNVDASKGSYAWNVDPSIPAGNDYALSFGQSPNVSYTPFFSIQAPSNNGGAASSGAAASSSQNGAQSATSAAQSGAQSATSAAQSGAQSATSVAQSAAQSATSAAHSAASSAHSAAHSAASSAASAAASPNAESAGNKNAAAIGVAAVAGAVVAALI